jgi:hypothetical protein
MKGMQGRQLIDLASVGSKTVEDFHDLGIF